MTVSYKFWAKEQTQKKVSTKEATKVNLQSGVDHIGPQGHIVRQAADGRNDRWIHPSSLSTFLGKPCWQRGLLLFFVVGKEERS